MINFGAGELVRDYLEIPGVSSSPSFLMPEEHMKKFPFHPDSEVPFKPEKNNIELLQQVKEKFGVSPKIMVQFMGFLGKIVTKPMGFLKNNINKRKEGIA
jgi:hypothetical protein